MLEEKIEEIKRRLSLNDGQLANLLDIKINELINFNNNLKLLNIFNITKDNLNSSNALPLLKITKQLNMKKYKNMIDAYNKIIKDNYISDWHIYVLTKTRVKEKFTISSLFKKTKVEKNEFSPSFLAINGKTKLLINFKKEVFIMEELEQNIDENLFIINNIKYKKANEINILKNINKI